MAAGIATRQMELFITRKDWDVCSDIAIVLGISSNVSLLSFDWAICCEGDLQDILFFGVERLGRRMRVLRGGDVTRRLDERHTNVIR